MKKQLLFLTAILFSLVSYSQVLISEDFNGTAIPTGWSTGANSGSQEWTFGSGVVPGNGTTNDFTTNAAIFDDDAAGNTGDNNNGYLRTTGFMDLSIYDNTLYDLQLKYDYAMNDISGEKLILQLYHDGWNNIIEYSADINPTTEVVNISNYLVSDFILNFVYDDIDGAYAWGAGIDNVELKVIPKNDSCVNAFVVNSLPYSQSLNAEGATNNDGFIIYTGGNTGMNDGVWYSFVGNGAEYEITVDPTGWDPEIGVLTGSCGSMTNVANMDDGGSGDSETLTFTSVVGTTYYVNVGFYSYSTDGAEGPFDISIKNTPPVNDECANAINLTVGNMDATHTVSTIAGATDYNGNGFKDVWFIATVPTSGMLNFETFAHTGSTFENTYIRAFSGTCSSLIEISSDYNSGTNNFSKIELIGKNPGDVIYFNVEQGGGTTNVGQFEVLAYEPPPVNNDCANAINLTVGNMNATHTVSTLIGATDDEGNGVEDVWFTATVPASGNLAIETFQYAGSGLHDTWIKLSSGTCSSLTLIQSNNDIDGTNLFSKVILSGRTPGEVIYIRVEKSSLSFDPLDAFEILAYEPPPVNDECTNAIDLTVGTNFDTNPVEGTLAGATSGTSFYPQVWYTATVPATGNLTIETGQALGSPMDDTFMSVFSGTCTTNLITSNDNIDDATNFFSKIELTGRTPGEIITIEVDKDAQYSGVLAEFMISAYDPTVSVNTLNAESISIFPNPANDFLNINSELNIESISIFDISGKEVINIKSASNNNEINVSNLKSGVYFVRIINEEGIYQTKFVKK